MVMQKGKRADKTTHKLRTCSTGSVKGGFPSTINLNAMKKKASQKSFDDLESVSADYINRYKRLAACTTKAEA